MSYDISPQPVYIYDKEKNKKLVLDGVTKVDHTVALKIEDDPKNAKKSKGYVNNALNEANEVTIEGVMSQVYTTATDLAGSSGDRLRNSYTYLEELKHDRRLVEVVTTLMTYKKMLLKSVQVHQDENNQFGYSVTIVLHEQIESKKNGHNASTTEYGTSPGRTPSVWVAWGAGNAIT